MGFWEWRSTFRVKAILSTSLVAVVLLVLLFGWFVWDKANTEIDRSSMIIHTLARHHSESLGHVLIEKTRVVKTLAENPDLRRHLEVSNTELEMLQEVDRKQRIEKIDSKWREADESDPFVRSYMTNGSARILTKHIDASPGEYGEIFLTNRFGAMIATTEKLTTLAHAHKNWWKQAYADGHGMVFFDDRGFDESVGNYVLGIVVPVWSDDGRVIGILKANVLILSALKAELANPSDEGIAKVVRSDGDVVLEIGHEPLTTRVNDRLTHEIATNEHGVIVDLGLTGMRIDAFHPVQTTQHFESTGFGGTGETVDQRKGNTGQFWLVVVAREIRVSEILGWQLPAISSAALTIFILIFLASIVMTRRLVKPIETVRSAVNDIAQGNFKVRMGEVGVTELDNLVRDVNAMAQRLDKTTTTISALEEEIRQKEELQRQLRREHLRAQRYLHLSGSMFVALDTKGEIILVNKKTEDVIGLTSEELVGRDWFELTLPEDQREKIRAVHRQVVFGNLEPVEYFENDIVTKDGRRRRIAWHNSIATDETGEVIGLLSSGEDITDRLELEDALRHAQRLEAIGQLTGGIAHDFNNLLQVIETNLELLQSELPRNSKSDELLKAAIKAGRRGADLTHQLLSFSRRQTLYPQCHSVRGLVTEARKLFERTLGEDISVSVNVPDDTGDIFVDENGFQNALLNIGLNARAAMPEGGRLDIMARRHHLGRRVPIQDGELKAGDYIEVAISDTGCGMSEETAKKAFEPFFTTREVGQGSGLGLSMVFGFARQSLGNVTIESELGKGTTVRILLPSASTCPQAIRNQALEPPMPADDMTISVTDLSL